MWSAVSGLVQAMASMSRTETQFVKRNTLNSLLTHVTEGKTEDRMQVAGRPGRRNKQLLDDFKETRE